MKSQQLKKLDLPDVPGVYTFKDLQKRPIYIGRATSLRDRVKSYFSNDLIETRGPRIVDMVTKSHSISFEKTDSVLEAIILESALIKKYQPRYNVDERDDKSSQYIVITAEKWPRVFLVRARDFDQGLKEGSLEYKVKKYFGPYPNSGLIKEALKILRKMFPFKDKKSLDSRHDSFYRSLGKSPQGDDEDARKNYIKTIANLILFFEGKKNLLHKRLIKEMNIQAKDMLFEQAGHTKRLIYALDHINDMALIKRDNSFAIGAGTKSFRIEAYDIAHMSGSNVVGAFSVIVDGEKVPSEYRKFKIKNQANNDLAGLVEILSRRLNHTEWSYPDLIVVDGNENQLKCAENLLKIRRISIPVVAVTKDERHKAREVIGNSDIVSRYRQIIISANAEAHRYVISFHRKSRRESFL